MSAPYEQWLTWSRPASPQLHDGLPDGPVPQWVQFGAALAAAPEVQTLVASLASLNPVTHLMLGVGLGQAAEGNLATFVPTWRRLVESGVVSPELLALLVGLARAHALPQSFIDSLTPEELD